MKVYFLPLFLLTIAVWSLINAKLNRGQYWETDWTETTGLLLTDGILAAAHNATETHPIDGKILTDKYFREVASSIAREFPRRLERLEDWCPTLRMSGEELQFWWKNHKKDTSRRDKGGLLFVKNPKAASSSIAGVLRRIVMQNAIANGTKSFYCRTMPEHIMGPAFTARDRRNSFLLSSVRDPGERAISRYFFTLVSHKSKGYTDYEIMKWLRDDNHDQFGATSKGQGGHSTNYLSTTTIKPFQFWNQKHPEMVQNSQELQRIVQKILEDYDFIFVSERMDESMVVLQLLLGLSVKDILISSSKTAGSSYCHFFLKSDKCTKLQKGFTSPAVHKYLSGSTWRAMNYGDYLLREAADISLDKTIKMLGHKLFDKALTEYQRLKELEKITCEHDVVYPCSDSGNWEPKKANCIYNDQGCGYQCVDKMLEEMKVTL